MDLEKELAQLGDKVDLSSLEAAFVKTAGKYAERKGISYAAWRQLGVSAETLKKAGITRVERGSSVGCCGEEGAQQHDAVPRSDDRVARTLGVRHEPHHVAALVGDPGDVVEAPIGVVDVAQDHAVFVAEAAQRLRDRRRSCLRNG